MSLLLSPTRFENDPSDERRGAIYLPDALAAKLLNVCDAAAGLESSEPNSPIHSDLDDLWSGILTSSVGSVDSFRGEEIIRGFAERYGLDHCLSSSDLSWLNKVGDLETPSKDLYKDILEAAFGTASGGTTYETEDRDYTPIGFSYCNVSSLLLERSALTDETFARALLYVCCLGLTILIDPLQFDEEAAGPAEWSPPNPHFLLSQDLPEINTHHEPPRFYYNRPHTPQVIRVNLSQKSSHDFWEVPNVMKKPTLFPPTLRNIRDWIFWRRMHRRRV